MQDNFEHYYIHQDGAMCMFEGKGVKHKITVKEETHTESTENAENIVTKKKKIKKRGRRADIDSVENG